MKKIVLLINLFSIVFSYGQIGLNTTDPKATLDVVGEPTNTSVFDGIIPPRITGDQLQAKTYTSEQNGTIVYVTQPVTAPAGQAINVRNSGLYVFDSQSNLWVSLINVQQVKNVYCNANDPNLATIFDDVLPVETNDSTLIQNSQNTYFGLDGSTWIWNGTQYVTFIPVINLDVGERVSVFRTMSSTAPNGTHLPSSGLIELDGIIRVGLNRFDVNFYKPYIQNITTTTIRVTFASGFRGATIENRYAVQASILPGANLGLDANDIAYWTSSITEILTADLILPNGKWYEIQWMAYQVSTLKHIYITVVRKF